MSSKQYSSVTSAVYSSYCLCRILKRVGSRHWNISRGADRWQSAERGQGGSPPQLRRACCRHAGLSEVGVLSQITTIMEKGRDGGGDQTL